MSSTTTQPGSKNIVIVGGHGKVALHLSRILSERNNGSVRVLSLIRDEAHIPDIKAAGAEPVFLSLEDASVLDISRLFEDKKVDVVYFAAGAGGKGGPERTKKVDYEGAIKVFDAIEATSNRPRLIIISAIDLRKDETNYPAHYNEEDIAVSKRVWQAIPTYIQYKYEADKNLTQRTAFKWTILRPGGLKDEPGTGKASIGRTHIKAQISREDAALALALLLDREDAAGLTIDLVGGDTPIAEGLDTMIKKGETDFVE